MRPKITLHGIWLWAWGLWIAAFLLVLLGGPPLLGAAMTKDALRLLFAIFLPLEVIGALDLRDDPPGEHRTAKTLSQFAFYIAKLSPQSRWYQSWRGLAAGFALLLSYAAAWVAWDVNPGLAVIVGVTLFVWLLYHFTHPDKHK